MKKVFALLLSALLLLTPAFAENMSFSDFSYTVPNGYEVEYESDSYCTYNKSGEVQLTIEKLDSVHSFEDVLELMTVYAETSEYDTVISGDIIIATFVPEDGEESQRIAAFFANDSGYWINIYAADELSSRDISDWDALLESITFNASEADTASTAIDTSGYTVLGKGAKGDDVKKLQLRLIELHYLADGSADGDYGNKTNTAIEKFQAAAKLSVTGTADELTQALLFSDDAPEAKLSISSSTTAIGSFSSTAWNVDGQEFSLKGTQTKTIVTPWGTYEFDAYGNYEKIND